MIGQSARRSTSLWKLSITQALHTRWQRQVYSWTLSRCRRATETVVDCSAKPFVRDWRYRYPCPRKGLGYVQQVEQVGGGLHQVGRTAQVRLSLDLPEADQIFVFGRR